MLKAVSSITNAIGALNYKGTWNASTNTPTLADGTGTKGDYYVVSTAGTQTFDGILLFFGAGDWIAYNGAVWQRVEGGSDGNFANVTLTSTDAGATASPLLELYRDSASPAASDTLGEIEFNGEDSAGNKQAYALIHGSILSPTSTAEQGQIHFETATAGALTEKMIIGTTNLVINEIGAVFNVRIEGDTDANLFCTDATNSRVGVGTVSPTTKLDVNGTVTATGSALGVALSGWDTGWRVYQAGTYGVSLAAHPSVPNAYVNSNCYYNGTNWIYTTTAAAAQYQCGTGAHFWNVAPSGTEETAISFTERMALNSAGIVTMSAYGAGAATFSASGVISSVSDETWKIKDGVPINPDEMLNKLEPGYWYYNEEKREIFGKDRQLGFYAQNVNAAIGPEAAPEPETVLTTLEDGTEIKTTKPWGYYDRSVLSVVVMSLKNALVTIESLSNRITELEAKL